LIKLRASLNWAGMWTNHRSTRLSLRHEDAIVLPRTNTIIRTRDHLLEVPMSWRLIQSSD
jgi:hypothetical protein